MLPYYTSLDLCCVVTVMEHITFEKVKLTEKR